MENTFRELLPFLDGEGRLTAFPAKQEKKRMALWYLAGKIAPGRDYTEGEINALLEEWTCFHDPATLRRSCTTRVCWTGRPMAAATARRSLSPPGRPLRPWTADRARR